MTYWTWGEIRAKVEKDHDIQEDPTFLAENELLEYLNEAIDKAEQHFIKLPDYFLASTTLSLTAGQRDYALPEDIYAYKIRKLMHDEDRYEIKELRNLADRPYIEQSGSSAYCYKIINNRGAAPVLRFYPTPGSDSTLTLDYIRNASRIDPQLGDDQEVDIPEAMGFIFAYLEWKLKVKEKIPFEITEAKARMAEEKQDLIDSLAVRIDDENNEVEPDVALLEDHI